MTKLTFFGKYSTNWWFPDYASTGLNCLGRKLLDPWQTSTPLARSTKVAQAVDHFPSNHFLPFQNGNLKV
jgi:hypothetical protein